MENAENLENSTAAVIPEIITNGDEESGIESNFSKVEETSDDAIPENNLSSEKVTFVDESYAFEKNSGDHEADYDMNETVYETGNLVIDDTSSNIYGDSSKNINQMEDVSSNSVDYEHSPLQPSEQTEDILLPESSLNSSEERKQGRPSSHVESTEGAVISKMTINYEMQSEDIENQTTPSEEICAGSYESSVPKESIVCNQEMEDENSSLEVCDDGENLDSDNSNFSENQTTLNENSEISGTTSIPAKIVHESNVKILETESREKPNQVLDEEVTIGKPSDDEECSALVYRSEPSTQNLQNSILQDWDAENGITTTEIEIKTEGDGQLKTAEESAEIAMNDCIENLKISGEKCETDKMIEKQKVDNNDLSVSTSSPNQNGVLPVPHGTRKPRLHLSTSRLSRQEVIDEILKRKPKSGGILPKKDIILAMELAKHSTQGSVVEIEGMTGQDENEILQILEADDVGDWRGSISTGAQKNANDLDIRKQVPRIIHYQLPQKTKRYGRPTGETAEKLKERKRKRHEDRDRQKKLALEQLDRDFKERPRRRPAKDPTNIAVNDLKRVLSSTPVITGKRKKPCYQPQDDDADQSPIHANPSSANIKTYTPKVKMSKPTDIETGLETIAILTKHLNNPNESDNALAKKTSKKQKSVAVIKKKPGRELQQLLGDEGAVRMLYDAAQKGSPTDSQAQRVKHTKKELEKKAKFVENDLLQLSSASEKALRGKRLAPPIDEKLSPEIDSLFPPAVPNAISSTPIASAKIKKKPKPAEASKILYRHSSSESFDGSEGLRRSISELSGLDMSFDRSMPAPSPVRNDSSLPQRKSTRPRKVSSKLSEYVADTLFLKKPTNEVPNSAVKDKPSMDALTSSKVSKPNSKRSEGVGKPALSPLKSSGVASGMKAEECEVLVIQKGELIEISLLSTYTSYTNALTAEVINQLDKAFYLAANDPSCKAILLTSRDSVFCQGIDLGILSSDADVGHLVAAMRSLATTLIFMEKPVIVGVHGAAVGMGVTLLPLCDVVVAHERSSFYTPYGRLGQGLETAASFTFPRIGKALVSELIYKGTVLSAEEAYQLGLVSQVASPESYEKELAAVVGAIVSQNTMALQESKKLIFGAERQNMVDALERECEALLKSWTNDECLSAIAAYLESGELLSNS